MKYVKSLLLCLLFTSSTFAINAEHVLWDKTPIPVSISLQEERLIHFPKAISIIDNEAANQVSLLKVQDTLYIKAKENFNKKRLLLQLMPEGEVIILSLSADEKITTNTPLEVILEQENANSEKPLKNNPDINAITLTRFAIQSIYAPARLLTVPDGVNRTPMQTRKTIPLFYGANIEAHPLISWHGGDFFVTAVELKNQLNKEVILDPRLMVGNWQTAAFYPTNTLAIRSKKESTTVFLVSDRPFHEALTSSREFVR